MQKKRRKIKNIKLIIMAIIAIVLLVMFSKNIINPQNKRKLDLSENTAKEATIVEPNIPVVSAGMIPIKPYGDSFVITNQNDNDWYNYSQGKPAYIMLNDGYYKSELERGITEDQLASNNVGASPVSAQDLGSIYMWIPRFAVNEQGDIQYIKDIQSAEDGFEVPDIFAYNQASETAPNFLLTGVWVAIDSGTNINSTISEMNSENGKYGFIANTIATQITNSDITSLQKYFDNIDNGTMWASFPIIDPTNQNRTILKIINQNNQEPIKASGTYNKETELIEIQVTYSQYGIARVLYEDNQELKLTSNNNKATATGEGLNIKYGTALITIIDNKGNIKKLEIPITSKVYVTLYTDGTLGFCSNNSKIAGKTISQDYGDISEKNFTTVQQVPWYSQRTTITTVEFVDEISPASTARWFQICQNLITINNINNLNTINVTNMRFMFLQCSNLTTLNLSSFNTSNVTDMQYMFYGCNSLTELDISSFNTSNVTNMYDMFSECSSLTGLDLNSFNTENVTDMGDMFSGCTSLTSLDLSSFDTSNVTNTTGIFYNCTSISQITFGEKWDKEITLPTLAKPCTGWYSDAEFTTKVAEAGANYKPAGPITIYANVPPDIFVKLYTDGTLAFCSNNSQIEGKTLSQDYGNIAGKEYSSFTQVPWNKQVTNITTVEFIDEIIPISTAYWLEDCTNLTAINNIKNLNTKNVINMTEMFCACTSLTDLDLSSFNTENVTDMTAMFASCIGLQSINLSSFNTNNVANMQNMFYRCENLALLDLSSFDTTNVTNISNIFSTVIGSKLTQITFGEKWDKEITLPTLEKPCTGWYSDAEFTNKVAEAGANYRPAGPITIYADVPPDIFVKLYTDGTLAFCSNNSQIEGKNLSQDYDNIAGKEYGSFTQVPWNKQVTNITTVEFIDEIIPTSTACWFYGCNNLTMINNIKNLNTKNVTNMNEMFCVCTSLIQLDLSSFNTENVTSMDAMFATCTGLQNINLSSFNTSKVTNMRAMFYRCDSLTSLDLSSFDTNNVTNTNSIFSTVIGSKLTQITFGEKWDKEITLPTLEKPCTGWYSDAEFTNKVAEAGANYKPAGPITIYAEVPPDIYVKLYTDGTLAFASNNYKIEGKNLSQDYGNIAGKEYSSNNSPPWYNDRTNVLTVNFIDKVRPISTYWWFIHCENLVKIDNIYNLDTSNVTKMGCMFCGCSSLTSLDLSNFDTSNVTDMTEMFDDCTNLVSIDLSNFDTRNVTDMSMMFRNCNSLTSLDLSNFNTSKVTNMWAMFNGCTGLTSLDLISFDTSNVTNTTGIFYNCTSLSQITFGEKWDKEITLPASKKTSTGWYSDRMFVNKVAEAGANYKPTGLITIYADIPEDIYTTLYTDGTLAFSSTNSQIEGKTVEESYGDISGIQFINVSQVPWYDKRETITTVEFVDKIKPVTTGIWFNDCTNLTTINNIENLDTSKVTNMFYMFCGCSSLTSLDLRTFDTKNVTDMTWMFNGCTSLTALDLSRFNTKNVTDMNWMFWGCNALTSLDLSNFDTSSVRNMERMFQNCSSLTNLDVSRFDTKNVTSMFTMFYGCSNLTSLDLSSFDTTNVTNINNIFTNCTNLSQITFGEKWDKEITLPTLTKPCTGWYSDEEFTEKIAEAGANYKPAGPITIYANVPPDIFVKLYTDGTLAFCSNNSQIPFKELSQDYGNIAGKEYSSFTQVPWNQEKTVITTVEFVNEIMPISTACWFYGCNNLTMINNIKNLNTKNVTSMFIMFQGCSSLTSLDVSNFDTKNVTNMNGMFYSCSSLISLDVSNFDTSNVTNTVCMFYHCSNLKSIDVSNFNTSNVTNMQNMFGGCSKLTSLDVSNFDTSNVTDMMYLFDACSNLAQIDVSNFDTSNIKNMSYMFRNCSSLMSLDISNFDTNNVKNMIYMFYNCSNLKAIYVGEKWTTNNATITNMFKGCGTSTVTRK